MKTQNHNYTSPEVTFITLITEQCILSASSLGGNEELLEDPDSYFDFFE